MLHNAMTVAMNQGVFCNCFMTCNQKLKYKSETYLEFFGMIFGLWEIWAPSLAIKKVPFRAALLLTLGLV